MQKVRDSPRAHLTRYHGVLAPAAAWRSQIVPAGSVRAGESETNSTTATEKSGASTSSDALDDQPPAGDRYYTWAELMKRVFRVDVLECEHCGGWMNILAVIRSPAATERILKCLALPSRAPPLAPASSDHTRQIEIF
jgi:hypothetical protein